MRQVFRILQRWGCLCFYYSIVYAIAYGIVHAGESPVADPPGVAKPKNENGARPRGILHTQKICKMKIWAVVPGINRNQLFKSI